MRHLFHVSLAILSLAVPAVHGTDIDYQKERFAFAEKSDFNPYSIQAIKLASIEIAMKSWESHKQAEAFKKIVNSHGLDSKKH